MQTILCPVDFSTSSENAVRYALQISKVFKSKIILMHAYMTPVLYSDVAPFVTSLDFEALQSEAYETLKKFCDKVVGANEKNVELVIQQGLPSARIIEIAIEKKADMIVMGSTGTTATERLVTGSNALRVANNAPCKVMLVPAKARWEGLEKIVYTTDLSNENLVQARELYAMARKFDSEIVLLHIDSAGSKNDDEVLKTLTRKSKQFISYRKKSGYVCSDADVTKGIDFFLKKQKADCLVVYHRHRNVLGAIFGKSVTQRVALLNNLPVIILHADDFFN